MSYLFELENELSGLLLFSSGPKHYSEKEEYSEVYDKFPHAYYDPTGLEKLKRVKELKDKILSVKRELNLNQEVELYVTVNNNTFPKKANDIVEHYNESYAEYKLVKEDSDLKNKNLVLNQNVINGNLSEVDDIYNIRKNHLLSSNNKNNLEGKLKHELKNHHTQIKNQIIEYLKKKN